MSERLFSGDNAQAVVRALTAVCAFQPPLWLTKLRTSLTTSDELTRAQEIELTTEYLGLTLQGLGISRAWVEERFSRRIDGIRDAIGDRTPFYEFSGATNPLLIMSWLNARNAADVDAHLDALHDFVSTIRAATEDNEDEASRILRAYGRCGLYWNAIADCEVPVDRSFMIKTVRKTELTIHRYRRSTREIDNPGFRTYVKEHIVVGDARSNHVVIRVDDPHLQLQKEWRHRSDTGKREPSGVFTTGRVRITPEIMSLRVVMPQRRGVGGEEFRKLYIPIRPTPLRRAVTRFILLLSVGSALAMLTYLVRWWPDAGSPDASDEVNLRTAAPVVSAIFIPVSIAAAFLLVREPSTLVSSINQRSHRIIGYAQVLLWVSAGVLFIRKFAPDRLVSIAIVLGVLILFALLVGFARWAIIKRSPPSVDE
ncbi:hypothetical protein ACFFR6_05725 [Saccharothrix mutabilis subsp. capreolus]|uniref:hypothetical protein n=1 Tax=Saccharothrix mutabilis TaxID=33921 RepID=UPI0035E6BA1C